MPTEGIKRVVVHPKLYLGVDKKGKAKLTPVGTIVYLTETQCKSLGAKVSDPEEQKQLDVKAQAEAAKAARVHAAVAKAAKSKK